MAESWDYLVADVQRLIASHCSHVSQLCLARTCKAEWEARELKVRFHFPASAPLVIQGGTSKSMVRAWVKFMENKFTRSRDSVFHDVELVVHCAREGWTHDDIKNLATVCTRPDTWKPYSIWDVRTGYIRGGHLDMYRSLDGIGEIRKEDRRCRLNLCVEMVKMGYLFLISNIGIIDLVGSVIHAGRFDVWERLLREMPTAREYWSDAKVKWQISALGTGRTCENFDHRIENMFMARMNLLIPNWKPSDDTIWVWRRIVWDKADLGDIQWMHERGYICPVDFSFHVLHSLSLIFSVDDYLMCNRGAYLETSPCTNYLLKMGYYKMLNTYIFEPWVRTFFPMAQRSWLDTHFPEQQWKTRLVGPPSNTHFPGQQWKTYQIWTSTLFTPPKPNQV